VNNDIDIDGVEYDNKDLLHLVSTHEWQITDASYHVKLLMGIYDMKFPIMSNHGALTMKSIGFFNLTPILYLVSNLSASSFSMMGMTKIMMRIANTFQRSNIIVESNADYQTNVYSTSLEILRLQLVDANLVQIKLLSPLYVSITIEPVVPSKLVLSDEEREEIERKEEALRQQYMIGVQMEEIKNKASEIYKQLTEQIANNKNALVMMG